MDAAIVDTGQSSCRGDTMARRLVVRHDGDSISERNDLQAPDCFGKTARNLRINVLWRVDWYHNEIRRVTHGWDRLDMDDSPRGWFVPATCGSYSAREDRWRATGKPQTKRGAVRYVD